MPKFEAYLHTNGNVIIKQLPRDLESFYDAEDMKSPFLQKYLGILEAKDIANA